MSFKNSAFLEVFRSAKLTFFYIITKSIMLII